MPFKFPATLETLDGVSEVCAKLYNQTDDGKFALDDDLKAVISQGGQLSEGLDKERKRATNLERELKAWKKIGETPTDVQTKLDDGDKDLTDKVAELQTLLDEKGDVSKQLEKMRADMEKAHAKELEEKDSKVEELESSLQKHLVETAVVTAISEAKGKVKPLLPNVLGKVKMIYEDGEYVVRVVDKDGDARGDGKGGFMDITGLVEELKEDPDYSPLFDATGITGSGAQKPNAGGAVVPGVKNPWAKEARNLTEQMRITRENPQLAQKLKAQVGVSA